MSHAGGRVSVQTMVVKQNYSTLTASLWLGYVGSRHPAMDIREVMFAQMCLYRIARGSSWLYEVATMAVLVQAV